MVDALAQQDPSVDSLSNENQPPLEILDVLYEKGYAADCKQMLQELIDVNLEEKDLSNQSKILQITHKVVTTNYDKALEAAFTEEQAENVEIMLPGERTIEISSHPDEAYLFKIHGTIDHPESCILFRADYDQLYKYDHVFLSDLKKLSANSVLFFIGYSINDIEIRQILINTKELFHT